MSSRPLRRLLSGSSLVALACVAFVGCGNASGGGSSFAGGGGHGGGAGGIGGSSGGGGSLFDSGIPSDGSLGEGSACAAESQKAELIPLDMFIMMDQSSSMDETVSGSQTKWEAVTGALRDFVNSPTASGLGVGIGYFGIPDPNPFSSNYDLCTARDYAQPDVEIATLPGASSAIVTSLGRHFPDTATPTGPALDGAIQHAKNWALDPNHFDHTVIVVLATDGEPTECDPTDVGQIGQQIAQPAAQGSPSIKTFVIGVGNVANLNQIAQYGGTGQAYITSGPQAGQQFLDALNQIRGSALACEYKLPTPEAGTLDPNLVNVTYTPGAPDGGTPAPAETLIEVDDANGCSGAAQDAWYYDDATNPTKIIMCPTACDKLKNDTQGGQVDVLLGCSSIKG